jgi:hypothetical protein
VVDNPWSNLYAAQTIDYAFGWSTPQLYGGYISPQSVVDNPNGMKFFVSQWNTSTNDPYRVMLFQGTLATGFAPFARARMIRAVSQVAPAPAAVGGVAVAAARALIGGIQGAAAGIRDGWSTARRSTPAVAVTSAGRGLNRGWAGSGEVSSPWSAPSVQAKTVAQPAGVAADASRASGAEAPAGTEPTNTPTSAVPTKAPAAAEPVKAPTRKATSSRSSRHAPTDGAQ